MHALYDLKSQLIEELEGIAKKGEVNSSNLEVIDKLAYATKNLCKVIEACEDEEYSNRMSRRSYADGMGGNSGRRSYDNGGSYRRGRDSMGRFTSRGRSWSEGPDEETMQKLEDLKESSDENTRRVIDRALQELRS